MFLKIMTVAGLASFEIYAAIPAGLAFELSPWIIFVASVGGSLAGLFIAAFFGGRIRSFFSRKNEAGHNAQPRKGLIHRIWQKYGTIGLGFLGTITVGAPISIAVGIGLKAPLRMLVIWCSVGVITRCAIFTGIGHLGAGLVSG